MTDYIYLLRKTQDMKLKMKIIWKQNITNINLLTFVVYSEYTQNHFYTQTCDNK